MSNVEFLDEALSKVESGSIRAWANSDHNRPIFEKLAQKAVDKGEPDSDTFASYVVLLAIGG